MIDYSIFRMEKKKFKNGPWNDYSIFRMEKKNLKIDHG